MPLLRPFLTVFSISCSIALLVAGGAAAPGKVAAPDPRAWPTAYEAITQSAADVLTAVRAAKAGDLDEGHVTYRIREGGIDGVERDVFRGADYRTDTTIGPLITAEGRFKDQRWETNENGYTLLKRGIHQRGEADARALEQGDPGADVTVLGRLRSPADVIVIRVHPPDGRDELRFYDTATYRLVRRETHYLDRLIVSTYEDYRPAGKGSEPFRTTYSDGRPANDSVFTIERVDAATPVLDAELSVPGTRRQTVFFPSGVDHVRLPAHIDDYGRVIVRLEIAGRGLDFQLDSGCDDITIDADLAKALNLPVYGTWSETVAGSFASSKTVVPKVSVGDLEMRDVVMSTAPFNFQNDESTKVVGLLGFDFIAGGIIKIDYEHGTVDAMPYDTPLPKDAFLLDAALDDDVPIVSAEVNGRPGDHFILDTGSDEVVLFSGFAQRNAAVISDHSPGKIFSSAFNLFTADGVGGELHTRALALEHFHLGPVVFNDFLSLVMAGDQPAFEGEDTDGLIGASVLGAFDVYLDYADGEIALVPNGAAKRHRTTRGLESQ